MIIEKDSFKFELLVEPYEYILCRDVDMTAVPDTPKHGPYAPMCARLYQAAGYLQMELERQNPENDFSNLYTNFDLCGVNENLCVTPGLKLSAKYVIHLPLDIYITYGERTSGQEKSISDFYITALHYGFYFPNEKIDSILLPMICGNISGPTAEIDALLFAERIIINYLEKNIHKRKVTVYLGMAQEYSPPYVEDTPRGLKIPVTNFNDVYGKFEAEFQSDMKFDCEYEIITQDEYFRKTIRKLFYKVESAERLSEEIGYDKGLISKFRNGKLKKPRKNRVLSMAIAMGLSDYDRYVLIRCAGYEYPIDARDRLIEKMLRSGITRYAEINESLGKVNPDYLLNNDDYLK